MSKRSKSNESHDDIATLGLQYKGTGGPRGVESMSIASEIGVLIKAQNRRIRETCKELAKCPDDPELCLQLRLQTTARDVLLEVLSAYFASFDKGDEHDAQSESTYHPFTV